MTEPIVQPMPETVPAEEADAAAILPAPQARELLILLQAIRREAERHGVVDVVDLAQRGVAMLERSRQETV